MSTSPSGAGPLEYQPGDIVTYHDFLNNLRRVRVVERESDINNGRPGFDGVVVSGPEAGETVWGYDYQITSVERGA